MRLPDPLLDCEVSAPWWLLGWAERVEPAALEVAVEAAEPVWDGILLGAADCDSENRRLSCLAEGLGNGKQMQ